MNDTSRVITLRALRNLYNETYASLERPCDDLQSVCAIVGELDPFLPDFESSASMSLNAATLRSQAKHAREAAEVLSAAASSFESLARLLSVSTDQIVSPVLAIAPAKTSRRAR